MIIQLKVENWVTPGSYFFSIHRLPIIFFFVPYCQPFQQLPDFPDVYWFEGKPFEYQAWDLVVFCLITICLLLDALLGSPNYYLNTCIILSKEKVNDYHQNKFKPAIGLY